MPQTPHWLQWTPHVRPQHYSVPRTDPETQVPASTYHLKPHQYPISHFATMH